MKFFRGLAGLAVVKWLGMMVMRWMSGRSQSNDFDPYHPPEGQQYWPPPGQYQYPGGPPPPQYPYPPQQHPTGQHEQQASLPLGDGDDVISSTSDQGDTDSGETAPTHGLPAGQYPPQPGAASGGQPPPQQPYYYPAPGYQQQPAPRKRRRRKGCLIFTLVLAVVLVVGVWIGLPFARDAFDDLRDRVMSALGMETSQLAGSFPVDDENLPTEDVGVRVVDNQLTFTVSGLECDARVSGQSPSGQFCLIGVAVENTGTEPRHFVMEWQGIIDGGGNRHPGVHWHSLEPLPERLDPGQSLDGQIAFDVPAGATMVYAQLHESPFSPGVLVDLR